MRRLAHMVTNQMMCLKQTQSLLYFAAVQRWKSMEHWLDIQISSTVIKWYTSSHDREFWNNQKQLSRGVQWKDVLEKFAKFTGKHLYQRLFFNKVAGSGLSLQLCLKRGSGTSVFLWILLTPFSLEHLRWLLLNSLFRRFSKIMEKISEEYQRKFVLFSILKFDHNLKTPAVYYNSWLFVCTIYN